MVGDTEKMKKRGRPAAFDYDQALQQAMHAFWQYGYEGTSMSTLMEVMQMNKASIYAAYGSKEALFNKVVERYVQGPANFMAAALQQPTALEVVSSLLGQAAVMLTAGPHPAGCLVTQGALACSTEATEVRAMLSGYRQRFEAQLKQRFERAQAEGDLLHWVDAASLAKLVMTLHQGMTVQAVSGVSQAPLRNMVETALKLIEASCFDVTLG